MLSNSPSEYQTIIDNIRTRIIEKAVNEAISELPAGASDEEIEIARNAATLTATPDADKAIDFIKQKEALVAEYYLKQFNVDIYELQRVAAENVLKIIN